MRVVKRGKNGIVRQGTAVQLASYFDQQPRKDIVVVTLMKPRSKAQIDRLNRYFLDLGYRQIVIRAGLNNPNRNGEDLILSDVTRPSRH